ncbi:nucleotidyltransferase domain-containing protein [Synoicihabitans lomoniglobus]|uniref:Nucleotidyltransferase n=1 Tax=Synoicihabitans lomoniglobus TaxID=2909285 RepID=A0AAE9ZU50_9BACT|nr:nucleotidyltransferase [Opitutaceae bacterium LMO-M01]WED64336.1 nucleotidyltransferase [Opitutaceae bacterium LMO-M01]
MRQISEWESVFSTWSAGPSQTEKERSENAENMIRSAIKESPKLSSRDIKVFTQGSYKNRVNVRRDSDVDIGVLCFDAFYHQIPDNNIKEAVTRNFASTEYNYAQFKNEVEEALINKFGRAAVTRGSKAFDIKASSYRVESDVAAFFEHRRYTSSSDYLSGVEMRPDDRDPPSIINWPEQHYNNGVNKNTATKRRFKRTVRILKSLSNEMSLNGVESAKNAPSFLCECLVWNVPNSLFEATTFYEMMRRVLAHLFNETMNDDKCSEWGEVSELKYLFRGIQPWTRLSAHQFVSDCWDTIGYK